VIEHWIRYTEDLRAQVTRDAIGECNAELPDTAEPEPRSST
jgi:hypothetical protein